MQQVFDHISNLSTKDDKISLKELVLSLSPDINNDGVIDTGASELGRGKTAAARYISLILHIEDQIPGISIITNDHSLDANEFKKCAQGNISGFTDNRYARAPVNELGQFVPSDTQIVSQKNGQSFNVSNEVVPSDMHVVGLGPKYVNNEIELTAQGQATLSRARVLVDNIVF